MLFFICAPGNIKGLQLVMARNPPHSSFSGHSPSQSPITFSSSLFFCSPQCSLIPKLKCLPGQDSPPGQVQEGVTWMHKARFFQSGLGEGSGRGLHSFIVVLILLICGTGGTRTQADFINRSRCKAPVRCPLEPGGRWGVCLANALELTCRCGTNAHLIWNSSEGVCGNREPCMQP